MNNGPAWPPSPSPDIPNYGSIIDSSNSQNNRHDDEPRAVYPDSGTGRAGPSATVRPGAGSHAIRIQEPLERRPLLTSSQRAAFSHNLEGDVFSCYSHGTDRDTVAAHHRLPVYTNIHRIRRDIISVVEDYLSLEQLRDVRLNVSVIRPLVDKLYEQDDISIVYCLLVNRAQFLSEQSHLSNRQNVNYTRAMLCELIATRILRRFHEDNEGPNGLLVLAHVLIAGFEPFQNAPEHVRVEAGAAAASPHRGTMPALEVAILSEARVFLASTACQKIVDAIYDGRIVYTPSSFMDILPDRYKQRPISLYDPRKAPLLNQYRLLVPRIRNYLEIGQFILLLCLYLLFMGERDGTRLSKLEVCFTVYALGWVLDQFATLLEHGWDVYAQNLWSFLDVTFALIYWVYLMIRLYGWLAGKSSFAQQALDVLALGAPVLVPRLAFNILSDNLVFLSLRSMMSDFALLSLLAAWCFVGFLLSLTWLGNGNFSPATISKWMIYIWFGLDGSGIQHSVDFHEILGPSLMVAFAFLGNTLFLTILVSMLSTTFSHIATNAAAEIQFRRAVMTLEGVKGDAIFAYPPPFNILAILFLMPLRAIVSPRWFHKIHVASVRLINLPILLLIALAERRSRWAPFANASTSSGGTIPLLSRTATLSLSKYHQLHPQPTIRLRRRFWDRWRITTHSDISTVFEVPVPDSVLNEITADDDMTRHLIRRQFVARGPGTPRENSSPIIRSQENQQWQYYEQNQRRQQEITGSGVTESPTQTTADTRQPQPSRRRLTTRRDSMAPFQTLRPDMPGTPLDTDPESTMEGLGVNIADHGDLAARMDALEEGLRRLEVLLERLATEQREKSCSRCGPCSDSGTARQRNDDEDEMERRRTRPSVGNSRQM